MKKKSVNILVISNMYPSKRNKTYGVFVKNQVEQLREKHIAVDIAVVRDSRIGKFHLIKKYFIWISQIIWTLIFKGKKYDIVHAHYIFPSGFFALWFKKLYGTRMIVTSHGGDIDQMSKKSEFVFKQTKKVLRESDHVIAVGEELKKEINEKFAIEKEKITVLNMGVNRKVFVPVDKKIAKSKLHLSNEKIHVLFVGNLIESKGLIELLDAYKMLQEHYPFLKLHIIGTVADRNFKANIDKKIASDGINGVMIYDPKSQMELAGWMAAADMLVLPSHIEGFGLVALEAMSTHTPVVASDVGGLSYLLNENAGILIQPQNTKSLYKGMKSVIQDVEKRKNLVKQGEIKAKENNQNEVLNRLLDIYIEESPISKP